MSDVPHIIRIVEGVPRVVPDDWRVIDGTAGWDDGGSGSGGLLLPLALARAHADLVRAGGPGRPLGLVLAPDDDPANAVPFFAHIALIGVQFPKFTDGRGYSTAVLLRLRHGWTGELRALGEVLQDQLFAMRRVGFDSFALSPGRDPQAALRAFTPFSDSYQGSVDQPLPAYARAQAS